MKKETKIIDLQRMRLLVVASSTTLAIVITLLSISMFSQASTVREGSLTGNSSISSANTTQARVDVVLIACYANGEGAPAHIPFQVGVSSSSAHAPEVKSGSDCAQVLSDLLTAGFFIQDVQPAPANGAGAYYTLVRNTTS